MRWIPVLLASLALAGAARADVVHLKNGKSIEGKATVKGDKVVVVIAYGTVSFPMSKVLRIERKESPIDVYDKRRAALEADDAAGRLKLAAWCRERGLGVRYEALVKEALEIDGENAEARRLLGFVRHADRWVTPDEKNRALGLVEFEGQWHKPESVAVIKAARADAQKAEAERRKAALELELKVAEIEKLRAERERLEAERRKLEAERARLETERRTLGRLLGGYPHFRMIGGTLYYYPEYPSYKRGIILIRTKKSVEEAKPEEKPEKEGSGATVSPAAPTAPGKAAPGG